MTCIFVTSGVGTFIFQALSHWAAFVFILQVWSTVHRATHCIDFHPYHPLAKLVSTTHISKRLNAHTRLLGFNVSSNILPFILAYSVS